MKFEEIKVNEIYEVQRVGGFDHQQVVHKHHESKTIFTLEVGSDEPYGWRRDELHSFKPIKNEKQNELDSTIEKLFKLTEELGVDVTLIIDGKSKKS